MSFKKIVFMAVVSVFCVGALIGTGVAAPPDPPKIGMSFQDMNNRYFVVMHEAVKQGAEALGAELLVTDARHDVTKQISDIEDMLQKGIDILLINPTDSVGVGGVVQAAKDAGVIVVAVDAQAEGPLDSFVGSRNYDAGVKAGEYLGKYLKGKGNVAILDGIPVVPILERVRGFKDGIANYPDIKIVDTQNGKQERSFAMNVTENMIQANPDLNAIFSVNDGGALGSFAAIESSGKDIALVSVDGNPEAVEAVLGDTAFKATVAQYPRDQVRIGLAIAWAKYLGAAIIPAHIPVDVTLLTKDNAEGFSW